jgi:DNA-binding NtrC family response regulator
MTDKILIVDDDEDLLEIMVERMQLRGMTVTSAKTVYEAFVMIEKEPFDVLIIDFMLPGIDGMQVIKTVRKTYPDMRIILQTAYATVEKESEALAVGAWSVVEKPVDLDRLTQLIGDKSRHGNR